MKMLNKLAVATFKHRFKDFLVLFIGLIISVAIFLMFSNLANNTQFLKANTTQKMIIPIFILGQFLLAFVTLIYLNFANNFLRELRQREYGLLMMLGANTKQIANLLMRETILIGLTSMIVGLFLGTGLTVIAGHFLQNLLHIRLQHFQIINFKGLLITIIFFIILYVLNGFVNRIIIKKTEISHLLSDKDTAEVYNIHNKTLLTKAIIGILTFCLGFWLMFKVTALGFPVLIFALILNLLGSYYVINSSISFVLHILKQSRYIQKGLGNFIVGQLTFRIQSLNKILTIISIMFALSYGALSVGLNFKKLLPKIAEKNSEYSLIVNNPDPKEEKYITELKDVKYINRYYYTMKDNTVTWESDGFSKQGLPSRNAKEENTTYSFENLKDNEEAILGLNDISSTFNPNYNNQNNLFTDSKSSNRKQIVLIKVSDLDNNDSSLSKLYSGTSNSKGAYVFLVMARAAFGGLEFLGFFLSIAFLSMLASTLMFKVLSNVGTDIRRYDILKKIGTKQKVMKRAVAREIGIIFAIPALIGGIDVAIGLSLFKAIMYDPYIAFLQATFIIYVLYIMYYLLTIKIYWKSLKQD